LQRLALILFGALLVVLFVGFAVAQGLGKPSVPEGDVILVENVPAEVGEISEADYRRSLLQQAASGGIKKLPKEGSTKFEELKETTLGELINAAWLFGAAEELGIKSPTAKKMEEELDKIKEQNFPTPAAYKEFLETSKMTQEDVDQRVELQILSAAISEEIQGGAGVPSSSEIADYYDSAKATQFTTKPSRDARIITNKDKAEVEAAKAELEADDSAANWKKVAQKYSSDPTTKSKGGLQPGLTEELLASAGPFKKAIFGAATNELVGPIKFQGNYTLIEVVKLNPEKVQTLEEAKAQISSTLTQQKQESALNEFIASWQSQWESRTFCAAGFTIANCSNYKGDGRPSEADPACYEADPKKEPTACPAVAQSTKPALPGSVTILQPKGEPLIQRPLPADAGEGAGEEVPAGIESVPGE
jgi:foldase protein PrsA